MTQRLKSISNYLKMYKLLDLDMGMSPLEYHFLKRLKEFSQRKQTPSIPNVCVLINALAKKLSVKKMSNLNGEK